MVSVMKKPCPGRCPGAMAVIVNADAFQPMPFHCLFIVFNDNDEYGSNTFLMLTSTGKYFKSLFKMHLRIEI